MELRLADLPASTNLESLLDLLGHVENEELDFKRQPAKLREIIPAMAMTSGGLVVIGVTNKRELHGARLDQATSDEIARAARDVGVDVELREVEVDGRGVVIITVPEVPDRIVTTPDGRLLRRVGSDNTPLVSDALARFVLQRSGKPAEEKVLSGVTDENFDSDLIDRALRRHGREPDPTSNLWTRLIDLGVAVPQAPPAGPQVLLAAGLLYGRDPREWCSGASVQLIQRVGIGPSTGPSQDRLEATGPLPLLLDQCLSFVASHTRSYEVVVGRQRLRIPEYPEAALREAILNALAHRDYSMRGATVDVTVWEDRVEIKSPGDLPAPITLENIRREHYSRNRRLMRALKSLGLVEEFGEGVDRMFEEMDVRLMDPPVISATSTSVTVCLFNRFLVSIEEQAWLSSLSHLSLSAGERLALAIAREEGAVTRRRLQEMLGSKDPSHVLQGAVAKGLLTQAGTRGGVRYHLSPELAMRTGASGMEAQNRKRQRLLDEIQRRGSLSTAEGAELLREDTALVRHLLNDLVHTGEVEARGRTRARRYHAHGL